MGEGVSHFQQYFLANSRSIMPQEADRGSASDRGQAVRLQEAKPVEAGVQAALAETGPAASPGREESVLQAHDLQTADLSAERQQEVPAVWGGFAPVDTPEAAAVQKDIRAAYSGEAGFAAAG